MEKGNASNAKSILANAQQALGNAVVGNTQEARFETASVRVGSANGGAGTFIGNFSIPANFSESSKEVIINKLTELGLKLSFEKKAPAEITEDLFA